MVSFFPKQFQHRLKLVGHYPFTKHSCLVNYNFEADTSRNLIVPISCSFQSKCLVSRISDISTMYCKTVSPPSTGTILLFSLCLHHPFGVLGKGVMPDKIPQLFLWHGHLTYIAQGKDCFILLTSQNGLRCFVMTQRGVMGGRKGGSRGRGYMYIYTADS